MKVLRIDAGSWQGKTMIRRSALLLVYLVACPFFIDTATAGNLFLSNFDPQRQQTSAADVDAAMKKAEESAEKAKTTASTAQSAIEAYEDIRLTGVPSSVQQEKASALNKAADAAAKAVALAEEAAAAADAAAAAAADATAAACKLGNEGKWFANRFVVDEEHEGIGDAAISPFGGEIEYKINALNHNIVFGTCHKVPFHVYYGDFVSKNDSTAEENKDSLVDPTQGFAIMFPLAMPFNTKEGALCNFADGTDSGKEPDGFCVWGADLTLRAAQLTEEDSSGNKKDTTVFGGSASLRLGMQFPIELVSTGETAGRLGFNVATRYYYHDTDKQDLLFGDMTDPDGNQVEFKKGFAALNAELELDLFKYVKVRAEYFRPFNNRDVLDDVFKLSLVVAPK